MPETTATAAATSAATPSNVSTTSASGAAVASSPMVLTPSQVLVRQASGGAAPSSDNNSGNNNNNRRRNATKKKNRRQGKGGGNAAAARGGRAESTQQQQPQQQGDATSPAAAASDQQQQQQQQPSSRRNRRGKNKKKGDGGASPNVGGGNNSTEPHPDQQSEEEAPKQPTAAAATKKNKKKRRNNRRKNNNNKKFPWRRHIPAQAVDPITLEPLDALRYPPFALAADVPYEPIVEWPIVTDDSENENNETGTKGGEEETPEERHRRILAEQWGEHHPVVTAAAADVDAATGSADKKTPQKQPPQQRQQQPCNLYDGRALAYYMVSQLQFIDPLNRRDLTRDELVNLDAYLRRHGFASSLNVVEAYDAKGVTISTAGAAGSTAAGRAAMLQQEAAILLNALFGGNVAAEPTTSATSTNSNHNNNLMQQYLQHEEQQQGQRNQRQQQQRRNNNNRTRPTPDQEETGIYGGAGFLVIDDDLNPALRGNAPEFVPGSGIAGTGDGNDSSDNVSTLWSASHIAARYGHAARVQQDEFPSLAPAPAPATTTAAAAMRQPKPPRPLPAAPTSRPTTTTTSSTLSKITKSVKKPDPEEMQRHYEAREAFLKRAALSSMSFGGANPSAAGGIPSHITTLPPPHESGPTEGQLERNRAFAQALDIAPRATSASQAASFASGWARPADGRLDAFGNELAMTVYPDSLIVQAKERLPLLLKIEKKWKTFLSDDTAASLPLNPMDRPSRALVHEYAAYYKLHTESFDAEPARYIHCVKLRDTAAPFPLLTAAVRNWRGPQPILASTRPAAATTTLGSGGGGEDHSSQQTAGQSTRSLPPPPDRTPLPLKPRSVELSSATASAAPDGIPIGGAPMAGLPGSDSTATGGRFAALEPGERPKLALQKRTLPLELAPYEPPSATASNAADELLQRQRQRLAEKQRKERERAAQKQLALEAAFASDDEEDDNRRGHGNDDDSSDSDWEEPQALYVGSDEEEE